MRISSGLLIACVLAIPVPLPARPQGGSNSQPGERVIYSFHGDRDGARPVAGLLADGNGALYGTTPAGGGTCHLRGGCGTVIKLTPNGTGYTETVLYGFRGSLQKDGAHPYAGLIADRSGALYGTTASGGGGDGPLPSCFRGCGTVFKLTPSGAGYAETVLYRFKGAPGDGADPEGPPIADKNGALYGTTYFGGGFGPSGRYGTVYKLTPAGSGYTERVLYGFQGGGDGEAPLGNLIRDASGALYGATLYGGGSSGCPFGCGTVFKLTPTGSGYVESVLYRFKGPPNDGGNPRAGLIADENGALYGTTYYGGNGDPNNGGDGTVFKLTPTGSSYAESVLHNFQGGTDGVESTANLIVGKNGVLFGTTSAGGGSSYCSPGCGTVFKLTPMGSGYAESILYSFHDRDGGVFPLGGLIADKAGALYGTTQRGGTACRPNGGCGTVFKVVP